MTHQQNVLFGLAAICFAQLLGAQQPAEFEVASVRKSSTDETGIGGRGMIIFKGIIDWRNVPLSLVIEGAYSVDGLQIRGAPVWLEIQRYDISAKSTPGKHTAQTFLPMVQKLLAERFGMVATTETADFPILKLVTLRSGPRMAKSSEAASGCEKMNLGQIDCMKYGTPMPVLAKLLQTMSGRQMPVQDATGLSGVVRFNLIWAPDESTVEADPRPSLDSALRDLGLRLERSTASLPILIIKKIERDPTEN